MIVLTKILKIVLVQKSYQLYRVVFLFSCFFLFACSLDHSAKGNSAETGSPELAGVLSLMDGRPASFARVQCVPLDFDPYRGDVVLPLYQTTADSMGRYLLDSIPEGVYALEAYHSESGMRFLLQDILVTDSTVRNEGKLSLPGTVRLSFSNIEEGIKGFALVKGTSILRPVKLEYGYVYIDSLPVSALDLLVYLQVGEEDRDSLLFDSLVTIVSADTVEIGVTPLTLSFVASLAPPVEVGVLDPILRDIPLAFRLDSTILNFNAVANLSGRWTAKRYTSDKVIFELPIVQTRFDVVAKEAVFWVRVDSLNATDSLVLNFNEGISPIYAKDVFPSSAGYTAVWHFDEGIEEAKDATEKSLFSGIPNGVSETSGAVGNAFLYDGLTSYVSIPNSADSDLNLKYDSTFNFSVWVRLDTLNTSRFIFGKGTRQYHLKYQYPRGWLLELFEDGESKNSQWYEGNVVENSNEWTFLSYNHRNRIGNFYVNGVSVTKTAASHTNENARYEGNNFEIGRMVEANSENGDQYFYGAIDELFMSFVSRSDAWTYVTYFNQKPKNYWPVLQKR